MAHADAIIVLGRGIEADGSLPPDAQARVRAAAELYEANCAPRVLMSGAWTYHFAVRPPYSEAVAMKKYATQLGVPEDSIFTEDASKDTIGNIYFTKQICQSHNWHNLVFVASEEHMPRIQYLVDKIYGPNYTCEFITSARVLDSMAYEQATLHEDKSMRITKDWFDAIAAGDEQAVWKLVLAKHPAYISGEQGSDTGSGTTDKTDIYPDFP